MVILQSRSAKWLTKQYLIKTMVLIFFIEDYQTHSSLLKSRKNKHGKELEAFLPYKVVCRLFLLKKKKKLYVD